MKLTIEKYVRIVAGSFILLSVILAVTVSELWLIWTVLIGINLIQSAFTNWCIAEMALKKLGVRG